jgi:hypothetical protein
MWPRQTVFLLFSLVAVVLGGTARGDILAQYSFTDVVAGTLNRDATTVAENVMAGSITDSPIVNTRETSVLTRATGIGYESQPTLAAARSIWNEGMVRDNVYFTFTLAPEAGFELDLSSLSFNVARGGSATPRDYDIRTSLDSFADSLTGIVEIATERPTFTPVLLDLVGAQFQNLTSPITFQFRFFTPGVAQNIDFDDITVSGTVAIAPAGLPGDFNDDGVVDAADYTVWRNHLDEPNENNLPNGNGGGVTLSDYDWWKQHYGTPPGSGGGGLFGSPVPEPTSVALGLLAAMGCALFAVRR